MLCACVSCLFVCVCVCVLALVFVLVCALVCAKGPNNASPLNKVLIPWLFAHPLPPPFLLSFSSHSSSIQVNYSMSPSIHLKLILLVTSYINSRKAHENAHLVLLSSTVRGDCLNSPACYQGFPWKVNIYLIRGLLGPELRSLSREEEGGRHSQLLDKWKDRRRRESLRLFYRPDVMRSDTPVMSRCDSLWSCTGHD